MRWDGVRDGERLSRIEAETFGDAARDMRAPLAFLSQNFEAGRFAKLDAGLEPVDGEADRSKPAAKISGEIKKTEMQSRRRRDPNAFQTRASFAQFMLRPQLKRIVVTLRKFTRFAKRRTRQMMR